MSCKRDGFKISKVSEPELTLRLDVAQFVEGGAGVASALSSLDRPHEASRCSIPSLSPVLKLPEIFSRWKRL